MNNIITTKKLRTDMQGYVDKVARGQSFIVFKRSKPVFRIEPVQSGDWEELIDFTKIKKGGIDVGELLNRL